MRNTKRILVSHLLLWSLDHRVYTFLLVLKLCKSTRSRHVVVKWDVTMCKCEGYLSIRPPRDSVSQTSRAKWFKLSAWHIVRWDESDVSLAHRGILHHEWDAWLNPRIHGIISTSTCRHISMLTDDGQRILWATMSLASNWALAIINSCSWRAINAMHNFLSESSMRCSYVTGGRANKAYYGLTVMIRSLHGRRKCFRIVASTANRDTVVETRTSRVRRRPSIANIISFPIDHLGCSLIARAKIS